MDDEDNGGRRRRTHSPAFKAQVLQACRQTGVSIAAVALSNGLNANLVRRWLTERDGSGAAAAGTQGTQLRPSSPPTGCDRFVPVQLAQRPAEAAAIRLELRRGSVAMSVIWPAQEAGACGTWLREVIV